MCLIRIRPASPPPSPTIPARFVPAPRLSIQAPTPRLSNHNQNQGEQQQQQRRSANSLPRKSSLKNPNRNSFSSSSPLPSANNVTLSRAEESRHVRPQGSFVRERPKGEVRESAAVKAVNFASPPPPSSAASTTVMDPIITTVTPRHAPAAQSPRSSPNSITDPAAAPSYTRPPPHAPQPPLTSTSSSSATRIPIVRQGSEYSYGVGPVRSSASSVDQIQASQLQRRLSSSTNVKVLGPTTSVEVVVAQRDEENRGYKIVRRISQSTTSNDAADAGKHERRHTRTLSSSNVNSHWGDPRSSANSIRWAADPRRISGNSISNGGQEWMKKKKDHHNHPMQTAKSTTATATTEPFGEEVPMRRLSSNPLPLPSSSSTTSTSASSPPNPTRTIPIRTTGALNFNPPPPSSLPTEESSASTAPLLQHHHNHNQQQQQPPPTVTTIMPPPPLPTAHHKRTYSRSSIHRSNSTASKHHRPHAQSLSTGPRNSQNSINNISSWGENPRASRASGRSATTTRERIVVVEEGGRRREYWQREEG